MGLLGPSHFMADLSSATDSPLASLSRDHPAQVFAALSARELVKLVQGANQNPHAPEAQLVLTAFYHRYGPNLVAVVGRVLGPLCDRSSLQEVVHDTFLHFFQRSAEFDPERAPDDDACDHNLRAYLAQLATWKARDSAAFHRSLGADAVDGATLDHHANRTLLAGAPDAVRTDPLASSTERISRVAEWLASLDDMEAEVLRTYYLDDHLGQKSDRLPVGVAQKIAAQYGVTTSAIRHVKLKLVRQFREKFRNIVPTDHARR